MLIGVPKETKGHEYRVGIPPAGVRELVQHGHRVMVEKDAGTEIGLLDEHYERAGAQVVGDVAEIFGTAEMIVKVKEPQPAECAMLRADQVLFTYLHLAADAAQTNALIDSGSIAIAYETVTDARGGLPLLAPMSEVAGRMSIQAGAHCLERAGRARRPARRSPRCAAGRRGDPGRRRGWHPRGTHGGRHGRAGHHHRPLDPQAPPARGDFRRQRHDPLLDSPRPSKRPSATPIS